MTLGSTASPHNYDVLYLTARVRRFCKKKISHRCETDAKLDLFGMSLACFLQNKIHIFAHISHQLFRFASFRNVMHLNFILFHILFHIKSFFRMVSQFFLHQLFRFASYFVKNGLFRIDSQFFRIKCLCFLSLSPVPAPFLWSLSLSPFYASCPFPRICPLALPSVPLSLPPSLPPVYAS